MGTVYTSNFRFPVPDLDAPANVPVDMKALADAVDSAVKRQGDSLRGDAVPTLNGYGGVYGYSLRFPNGVQICWVATSITTLAIENSYGPTLYSGTIDWVFQQAFKTAPAVSCSQLRHGSSASWPVVHYVTTSQATIRAIDVMKREAGTSSAFSAIAVGQWK